MFGKTVTVGTLALAAAGTWATAGVGSSGGGAALVCRDAGNKIQYTELLDLYESKEQFSRKLWKSTGSISGDYLKAVKNTYRLQGAPGDFYDEDRILANLKSFFDRVEFIPHGQHLPWLGDTGYTIAPLNLPGCKYEQLAIFADETQKISIDEEIWKAMDAQNQAALVSHELFYKYQRELNEKTSENTRSAIGIIYSETGTTPVLQGLPAKRLHCGTSNESNSSDGRAQKTVSDFYVYPSYAENGERKGLLLQFTFVMGRNLLSKTTVSIDGWNDWDVRLGDPEHKEPFDRMVVWEKGANKKLIVPFYGEQTAEWELEIEYVYRQPVRLTLIQKIQPVQTAQVDFCSE